MTSTDNQDQSLPERIKKESNLTVAIYTLLSVSISTAANALLADHPDIRTGLTSLAPAIGVIITYVLLYFAMRKKKGDENGDDKAFFDKEIAISRKKVDGYLAEIDNASAEKKEALKKLIEEETLLIKSYTDKKIECYLKLKGLTSGKTE